MFGFGIPQALIYTTNDGAGDIFATVRLEFWPKIGDTLTIKSSQIQDEIGAHSLAGSQVIFQEVSSIKIDSKEYCLIKAERV